MGLVTDLQGEPEIRTMDRDALNSGVHLHRLYGCHWSAWGRYHIAYPDFTELEIKDDPPVMHEIKAYRYRECRICRKVETEDYYGRKVGE